MINSFFVFYVFEMFNCMRFKKILSNNIQHLIHTITHFYVFIYRQSVREQNYLAKSFKVVFHQIISLLILYVYKKTYSSIQRF